MKSEEIREKFLKFFEKKGHTIVASSSLVPEGDSSVLFTTAGMQQFKPYYIGKKDPKEDFNSFNTTSVQKCVRTSDIEEVGDERHLTFFEMLGNFSFGGYWKKEAIEYAHEFVTKEMGLKIDYVTVFEGEPGVPEDKESEEIWKSIDPNIVVKKFDRADNFWGPTGEEGPCGPTTEIYVDGIEIWNIVFNEFYQDKEKNLKPLEIKGIDTGMGLERLALVSQFPGQTGDKTVFETDLFSKFISLLPDNLDVKKKRILSDHIRTISFMVCDGVRPSNKEAGYILRRLLRRVLAQFEMEQIKLGVDLMTAKYKDKYPELNNTIVMEIIQDERNKFVVSLNLGMKELDKLESIDSEIALKLYTSYGLPFDVIKDKFPELDIRQFEIGFEKHKEISRSGIEQKFKGGLGGHSEMEVKYHTATHLLHQALRDVLGGHVEQKGSNITPERLRFDFSHPQKMTDQEKLEVENIVNQKIKESLPVNKIVMPKAEAEQIGALHFFGDKYGEEVSVYFIGPSLAEAYSKEFCGGPHVSNTSELGTFRILKEEAVAQGIRRIKAILS